MPKTGLISLNINTEEVQKLFDLIPGAVEGAALQSFKNSIFDGRNFLSKGIRSNKWILKHRSTQLRKSVTDSVTRNRLPNENNLNGWVGFVDKEVPYAKWLNFGTGLFGPFRRRIRPKRAKVLSWVSPGGKRIFAHSVKGIFPRGFIEDTRRHMEREFSSIVAAVVKKELDNIGG